MYKNMGPSVGRLGCEHVEEEEASWGSLSGSECSGVSGLMNMLKLAKINTQGPVVALTEALMNRPGVLLGSNPSSSISQ